MSTSEEHFLVRNGHLLAPECRRLLWMAPTYFKI